MNIEAYIKNQLNKHPSMQPQDIVKMCYQAAFGGEHLLSDIKRARAYFDEEFSRVPALDGDLYEEISPEICRINLSAWKKRGLPPEWLFNMFSYSCKTARDGREKFLSLIEDAQRVISSSKTDFSESRWQEYIENYMKNGISAVHHSEKYREGEKPFYRIADSGFIKILPILERAKAYAGQDKVTVIAVDGRAASGKTTLAGLLSAVLEADTVHMDDFFVPPELRSEKRFQTVGENIHHERFSLEVLPFISGKNPFSYRIFDCSIMDYNGIATIKSMPFRIVEGSYSCHPIFGKYADITVFSSVSEKEQLSRIRNRNGERLLSMFTNRWIPMEEEYFSHFEIREKADITLNSD